MVVASPMTVSVCRSLGFSVRMHSRNGVGMKSRTYWKDTSRIPVGS